MRHIMLFISFLAANAMAAEPQVVITSKSSLNGYAMVAGKIISDSREPIGISVDNSGVRYSTVADPQGSWAIVFRHGAVNFIVRAWHLNRGDEIASTQGTLH